VLCHLAFSECPALLVNGDSAGPGVDLQQIPAAANCAAQVTFGDLALNGDGVVDVNAAGTGLSVEIKCCRVRQINLDRPRAGIDVPGTVLASVYANAAAAGASVQRTFDIV
jgi:hypothetical protein